MENKFVAYYRVSTMKQGMSGLGLDSQRQIVSDYIRQIKNVTLLHEFTEVETGKADNRPELMRALKVAKENEATLVIAKLDRLSRNLTFISSLMDSHVKFVCADMPDANEMTIHIFGALAQWERKRISERTISALQAKKVREPDWKPGTNNLTEAGREKAYSTIVRNAKTDTSIRHAFHYISTLKENGHSYQQIATRLNTEGYLTRTGKSFHPTQVRRIWKRFELEENQKGVAS